MLAPHEEVEAEVRKEDQERINEFGRNNALLAEIRQDIAIEKEKVVSYDDANTELMMGDGENVQILVGEAFVECTEDYSISHLEELLKESKQMLGQLSDNEEILIARQSVLKKELYGRFGSSINLEDK